jgi:hypothetical protein
MEVRIENRRIIMQDSFTNLDFVRRVTPFIKFSPIIVDEDVGEMKSDQIEIFPIEWLKGFEDKHEDIKSFSALLSILNQKINKSKVREITIDSSNISNNSLTIYNVRVDSIMNLIRNLNKTKGIKYRIKGDDTIILTSNSLNFSELFENKLHRNHTSKMNITFLTNTLGGK